MTKTTVAEDLASWLSGWKAADLPSDLADISKACVLDHIGAMLVGSQQPWNRIPAELVAEYAGKPEATMIGFDTKVPAPYAAYANATFGQGSEIDDYLGPRVSGHGGAVSIPVVLALSELKPVDGTTFVKGLVAGYEVFGHLMLTMRPGLLRRGFYLQSAVGVYGSTAAAAMLLDLDEGQTVNAIAIAGSHACGSMEFDQVGGEIKRLHSGLAARNGIQSAMLASRGLTGPGTIFEGPKRGVLRSFSDYVGDPKQVFADLGNVFVTRETGFKVHPTRASIAGTLDIVLRLRESTPLKPDEVEKVTVRVAESIPLAVGGRTPHDVIGAQSSLPFCVALALKFGRVDLDMLTDSARWTDEDLLAIAAKVELREDHTYAAETRHATRVTLQLTDGRQIDEEQLFIRGSQGNPIGWDGLVDKFRNLATPVLTSHQIDACVALCDDLLALDDVGREFIRVLTSPDR